MQCLTLSEVQEEGIKILERQSDNIKMIKQPPGTGKTKLAESYIAKCFLENKAEVIVFATDKNLLAIDSYNSVKNTLNGTRNDYLIPLNSQTASESGTMAYCISRVDPAGGGNMYFNFLKENAYVGPVAIFTTPVYLCTTYPSYFLRSVIDYCIYRNIQLRFILDEGDACVRSLISEIDISAVMQRKDCRTSRGYATTNINSNQSFLPINNLVKPRLAIDEDKGTITGFIKVSQINRSSFEEFECVRPDDFCYLVNGSIKFNNSKGNLHLEFNYYRTNCVAHEVAFEIEEIFVVVSEEEKISIARFIKYTERVVPEEEVILNPEIISLVKRINQSQSQQAGSTLLYLCQKIASSNCIYIRSLSCKAGEQYLNWLKGQGQTEVGEYLNYDQAVEAYTLYQNTEKAELHNYLKRPKVGNIYKFRLVFMESAKLKRLKKIMTAPDLEAYVVLLSATFSNLLLGEYESRLVIEKCNNIEARSSWAGLFTHFMDDEQFFSTFSSLRLKRPGSHEPIESQSVALSRWFLGGVRDAE